MLKEILDFIRGLVRPVITLTVLGSLVGMILLRIPIPDQYWQLAMAVAIFWFATRPPPGNNNGSGTGTT